MTPQEKIPVTVKDDELQQIVRQVVTRVLAEQNAPPSNAPSASVLKTIAIGADHGGVAMKTDLVKYLNELGYAVNDCGAFSADPVDYPDIAYAIAKLVSDGAAARGIVIDGAGIGSAMTANKVPGVRAALCYDLSTAHNAREHNDANVLTLGARLIGAGLARDIVKAFLETECVEDRHQKRVAKIMDVEKRYLRK
ncbi:MAG: ribose 5-phosphate isomerase B [Anaerolineales bacterium]|nr:ribose 5-phosphate isomerase B [Anaerolineales bacterium]